MSNKLNCKYLYSNFKLNLIKFKIFNSILDPTRTNNYKLELIMVTILFVVPFHMLHNFELVPKKQLLPPVRATETLPPSNSLSFSLSKHNYTDHHKTFSHTLSHRFYLFCTNFIFCTLSFCFTKIPFFLFFRKPINFYSLISQIIVGVINNFGW